MKTVNVSFDDWVSFAAKATIAVGGPQTQVLLEKPAALYAVDPDTGETLLLGFGDAFKVNGAKLITANAAGVVTRSERVVAVNGPVLTNVAKRPTYSAEYEAVMREVRALRRERAALARQQSVLDRVRPELEPETPADDPPVTEPAEPVMDGEQPSE